MTKSENEDDQKPSSDQVMALSLLIGFMGAGSLLKIFLEKPNDLSFFITPVAFSLIGFISAIVTFVLCLFDSDKH